MTQDELIDMATQSGFSVTHTSNLGVELYLCNAKDIKCFAKLVADKKVEGMVMMTPNEFKSVWDKAQAEEREACAKIVESFEPDDKDLAQAIRTKGKT